MTSSITTCPRSSRPPSAPCGGSPTTEPPQRADLVITSSRYSAGRITEALGIPSPRVEVIYGGIDHERFTPDFAEADGRLRSSLGLDRPFVLYPANLWPHKNHERLVRAFAEVSEKDLELVLTGQTYGRLEKLKALGHASGISERVRHLGYVRHRARPCPVPKRPSGGISQPVRRLRRAAARGDGLWLSGRLLHAGIAG